MRWSFFIMILLVGFSFISADQETCKKVYYFVVGNNWNFNETDVVTNNISSYYLSNYTNECYLKNLSDPLPINLKDYPVLIIYKNTSSCQLNLDGVWGTTIPIKITIFSTTDCDTLRILRFFFKIESQENPRTEGIRVFPIVIFLGVIFFFVYLFKIKRLNKRMMGDKNVI